MPMTLDLWALLVWRHPPVWLLVLMRALFCQIAALPLASPWRLVGIGAAPMQENGTACHEVRKRKRAGSIWASLWHPVSFGCLPFARPPAAGSRAKPLCAAGPDSALSPLECGMMAWRPQQLGAALTSLLQARLDARFVSVRKSRSVLWQECAWGRMGRAWGTLFGSFHFALHAHIHIHVAACAYARQAGSTGKRPSFPFFAVPGLCLRFYPILLCYNFSLSALLAHFLSSRSHSPSRAESFSPFKRLWPLQRSVLLQKQALLLFWLLVDALHFLLLCLPAVLVLYILSTASCTV
ncbi:hypothetical protein GQ54DRAFT_214860 [Martensiomyces pterosporus]|nr:hypothetical protein GQ54DRAFT_214860 [Martensiomyces pterosporus]